MNIEKKRGSLLLFCGFDSLLRFLSLYSCFFFTQNIIENNFEIIFVYFSSSSSFSQRSRFFSREIMQVRRLSSFYEWVWSSGSWRFSLDIKIQALVVLRSDEKWKYAKIQHVEGVLRGAEKGLRTQFRHIIWLIGWTKSSILCLILSLSLLCFVPKLKFNLCWKKKVELLPTQRLKSQESQYFLFSTLPGSSRNDVEETRYFYNAHKKFLILHTRRLQHHILRNSVLFNEDWKIKMNETEVRLDLRRLSSHPILTFKLQYNLSRRVFVWAFVCRFNDDATKSSAVKSLLTCQLSHYLITHRSRER